MGAIADKCVLITGGSGFLGRHVLVHPFAEGAEIHNLDISGQELPGVTNHLINLKDSQQVTSLLAQVAPDAIFHLAAGGVAYGTGNMPDLLQTNVIGLHYLLDAASRLDRKPTVVIAGSGYEYGVSDKPVSESTPTAPFTIYGVSKAAATALASYYATTIPIISLRLFNLYGSGEKSPRLAPHIIDLARNGQPIELTEGEQVRDYTFADDAAEAFWRALDLPASVGILRIFNVATGRPCTVRAFAEILGRLLEERGLKPELRFGAKPYRSDEPPTYTANVDKLEQTFGWVPSTHLEDGLRRMIDAHLSS